MQSMLVRCTIWWVAILTATLGAAESPRAERRDAATSREAWNRKLKRIDRIYNDVQRASRNGDSATRRKAFQRLKDFRASLEQEQRERVRILGRNQVAWTQLEELEDSIRQGERAFNENVDNAAQRLQNLIEQSQEDYQTEHARWTVSGDVRERGVLSQSQVPDSRHDRSHAPLHSASKVRIDFRSSESTRPTAQRVWETRRVQCRSRVDRAFDGNWSKSECRRHVWAWRNREAS